MTFLRIRWLGASPQSPAASPLAAMARRGRIGSSLVALVSILGQAAAGEATGAAAWRIPTAADREVAAFAIDESSTLVWLEGTADGAYLLRWQELGTAEPSGAAQARLSLGERPCALFAWRGLAYAAGARGIFRLHQVGRGGADSPREPVCIQEDLGGGCRRLALGADGRLYGLGSMLPDPAGPAGRRAAVFRIELDGRGFEWVDPVTIPSGLPEWLVGAVPLSPAAASPAAGAADDSPPITYLGWQGERYRLAAEASAGRGPSLHRLPASPDRPAAAEKAVLARLEAHLDRRGDEDLAGLYRSLGSGDLRQRTLAAWALTREADGLAVLQTAAGDPKPERRHVAMEGLGIVARLGHGLWVPGDDVDFSPLPRADDPRAAAAVLAALLEHPSAATRARALRLLRAAQRPQGLIPFAQLLRDPSARVRREVLLTAAALRQAAVLDLLPPAEASDPLDLDALTHLMTAALPPATLSGLHRHPDSRVRQALVRLFARDGSDGLHHLIFDADPRVAAPAVEAAAAIGSSAFDASVARRWAQGSVADWPAAAKRAAKQCVTRHAAAAGG